MKPNNKMNEYKVFTITDISNIVKECLIKYNKDIIKEDITRNQLDNALEDLLKSKEFEKRVNNIVVDTVGDFLESMWTKKSFWKTMLKRK
jgi:hypothetical protein